jgi:hypothetical protein
MPLEQFDDDSLFGFGLSGAGATAPRCPVDEVVGGRTVVVCDARIGSNTQQGRRQPNIGFAWLDGEE